MLPLSGELRFEIVLRIRATWIKWRSTNGILCDGRVNGRPKSKIYRNVTRPIAHYGSEMVVDRSFITRMANE